MWSKMNYEAVVEVLLADGWHRIVQGTFDVADTDLDEPLFSSNGEGVGWGFRFVEVLDGERMAVRVRASAVLAVRSRAR